MVRTTMFRRLSIVSLAFVMLGLLASPAAAQLTSVIKGKVVDDKGQAVPDVEIKGLYLGDKAIEWTTKTSKNGDFLKAGLAPGPWKITATKDKLVGSNPRADLGLEPLTLSPIVLGEPKNAAPANMSSKEVEANNKKQEQMATDFAAAKVAFDAGNFDDAIAGLEKVIATEPKCAGCYNQIGEAYMRKKDTASAEKAYLKSIEVDPTKADAYNALSSIYNGQKKFEEAGKMSAKASEISGAAGGGGGSAQSVYNQGVILWNQTKAAEAEVQFDKATKLDPKMADAFYWLGMCRVNQGKLPAAKGPFDEYMKLAPTGQYADQVKAMLAVIK